MKKQPAPRDITAVMLDLLEAAEGHVPQGLINEGHVVLSRHLMQHGTVVTAWAGRPPIDADKRAAIVDDIKAGGKRADIAKRHGVHANTVYGIAKSDGLLKRQMKKVGKQ